MQFLIMHRTNAHWENGAIPTRELIERVGKMIGELVSSGKLVAGEGLRPSSQGVRLRFAGGKRTVQSGPFAESKDVIGGFVILKATSIEEAIEWVTTFASALGDAELDVRPVTEAWDLGLGEKPSGLTTTRYMATYKRRGAERDSNKTLAVRMSEQLGEMERAGVLLSSAHLEPAAKGACLVMSNGKPLVIDGPFTESKELLGGFVIISEESLPEAVGWAERYQAVVGAEQVEVRQIIERANQTGSV
jgi:hypothetical protein